MVGTLGSPYRINMDSMATADEPRENEEDIVLSPELIARIKSKLDA